MIRISRVSIRCWAGFIAQHRFSEAREQEITRITGGQRLKRFVKPRLGINFATSTFFGHGVEDGRGFSGIRRSDEEEVFPSYGQRAD